MGGGMSQSRKREGIYFAQREPNVIFSTYFRALFSVGVGVAIITVEKMEGFFCMWLGQMVQMDSLNKKTIL